jgi:hypothetical protein
MMPEQHLILRIDTVLKSGQSPFQVLDEGPKEKIFAQYEEVSLQRRFEKESLQRRNDPDKVDYVKKSVVRCDNSEVKSERYPPR